MFDFFFKPFAWLLLWLYQLVGNFGIAIILFSLVTKLILLPLSMKGKKSMLRQTRLQPKLQALQKQYAGDQKKQSEMMQKLYQEEGISPLGGCGWSLLPFPIFLILYAVLRQPMTYLMGLTGDQIAQVAQLLNFTQANGAYEEIQMAQLIHENFTMLSQHITGLVDINFMFFGINLAEIPNWQFWIAPSVALVIPILSGLSAWLQQHMATKQNGQVQQAAGGMGAMMKIMPLMSVWFGFIMPAAMGVYWIVNSLFGTLQDFLLGKYYTKKFDDIDALKEEAAERKRQKEKEERSQRIAQQQAIAEQQRASAGRPKSKKKKGQKKGTGAQPAEERIPRESEGIQGDASDFADKLEDSSTGVGESQSEIKKDDDWKF